MSYLISTILIIPIYYGLNYFTKKLVIKEYATVKNRVSKTKIQKTISRRNQLHDYEFTLNPNLEKFNLRLLVKVIDLATYYLILNFVNENYNDIKFVVFFPAFLALFLINPILESLWGRTIGKFIFGLEVIDDRALRPSFLISYLKNLLQLGTVIVYISSHVRFWEDELFFHNKKTLTYTIKTKEKENIRQMIKTKHNTI